MPHHYFQSSVCLSKHISFVSKGISRSCVTETRSVMLSNHALAMIQSQPTLFLLHSRSILILVPRKIVFRQPVRTDN